ncbi:PIR Superfamily Protein [Plasmodium ovale curtisi]|uniref:PIR Superfamily Protein n=1 Tax=Plasmodium ovale curtisi TaxID=864141 RepID=A0A1A8XEY2_PLAOA|nr:PIR Superfamily Protein [Plasmodium ovale curtisi]
MAEDTVLQAIKLLEKETGFEKISDLDNFLKKFSDAIKNAYAEYEQCIEEKKRTVNSGKVCKIDVEAKPSLDTLQGEFKSAGIEDINNCDYLLYWMSDKIEVCGNNSHCIIWLYNVFSKFWKNGTCCEKKVNGSDKCEKPFVIDFDKNLLKHKKEIYEFLKHYNKIENTLKGKNLDKKKVYCKYVKYMFDRYHSMGNEYSEHLHNKCDKEFKYFQGIFKNSSILSNFKTECNYSNLYVTSHREEYKRKLSVEPSFERFTPNTIDSSKGREDALKEMDSILEKEPSHKLYKEFDKEEDDDISKKSCDTHFKEENKYSEESKKLCKKIVKNFNKLYTFESTLNSNERCLHYKNWVYGELWKMIKEKSYHDYVKDIINKFMDLQNKKFIFINNTKTFCHYFYIFKDLLELNVKLEEKDLHDYFRYYDTLENKVPSDISNKEKYRKYLDYISILYIRHKDGWGCCDESYGVDPLCRHYFKCEDEYNPSYLISLLNKKPDLSYKKKKENFPVVLFGEADLKNNLKEDDVMRIQYGRCTNVYDPKDKKNIFGRRCDYRASRKHFDKIHSNLTNPNKKDAPKVNISISSLPANLNNVSDISSIEENESNPSHSKIGTSVALALGGIFVFFLYYKFTPFGSLFGKRGQGKARFEDDFNEEYMREFSYHDSEYEDINSQNRRIQLAYQRA